MARQIRVVISAKHPQGMIWVLDKQTGWCELAGSVSQLGLAFDGGILKIDAELTVGDSLVEELIANSSIAPEPILLLHRECCTGE
jgi:hypothetical protein